MIFCFLFYCAVSLLHPSWAGGGGAQLLKTLAWRDRNKNPVIYANVLVEVWWDRKRHFWSLNTNKHMLAVAEVNVGFRRQRLPAHDTQRGFSLFN